MVARFPVQTHHHNPMGHLQGGMFAAMFDNVIGPLTYSSPRPSATAQISVTYLAPVTPAFAYVEVTARLVSRRAGRQLVFEGTMTGPEAEPVAVAHATQTIVRRG